MFEFCPHCGQTLGQEQRPGQTIVCRYCAKTVGTVSTPKKEVIDETDNLIRSGAAARCPACAQVVQLKTTGTVRAFVPHQGQGQPRKMCPQSGKPLAASPASSAAASPIPRPPTSKDLSAYITRDVIKLVLSTKDGSRKIEELTLEYLDKADRVRLQIDALRELLGQDFHLKTYPAALNRPHLAVWGNNASCVIARKHPQGGYERLSEAEIKSVLEDIERHRQLFFQ